MNLLRKIFRIPLFLFWFLSVSIGCRVFNHGRNASERSLKWTRIWAKVTSFILGLRIKVSGDTENFSGGLIVANHQSYLDILVLASVFKIRFAPKAEMRRWPLIGFMTQCNLPVWIDRSTPAKAKVSADAMSRTMAAGQAMMVFPEGTTSDGREGLLPFKSTAFQAAIDAGTPVIPVIINYSDFCRSGVQWFGHRAFLPHVWQVLGMKEIEASINILEAVSPQKDEDRKKLALRVYDIMNEKWRSL